MRSVEDQLILQGDSFTYHFAASRHHAAPHRVAPCCTHHHNAGPHDHVVHIILLHLTLHFCPVCHNHVVIQHVSCACKCLPLLSMLSILAMLSMLAMLHQACHVVHACHVAPCLRCCPCFTMLATIHACHVTVVPCIYTALCTLLSHASIQHYVPCCPMHLYSTMYLATDFSSCPTCATAAQLS